MADLSRYTAILPSASRPHLLERSLETMFEMLAPIPSRLVIHDDAAFRGQRQAITDVVERTVPKHVDAIVLFDDPPIHHGPALYWLLSQIPADERYCFYTQDDWEFVRPINVLDAFQMLEDYGLHHIRFNKRETMPYKGEGETRWYKKEVHFARRVIALKDGVSSEEYTANPDPALWRGEPYVIPESEQILTISDHWYFQASVWRLSQIKPVVTWWYEHALGSFREASEIKINKTLNGQVERAYAAVREAGVILPPAGSNPAEHAIRQEYQRTFIWGPIGEKPYVQHLGVQPHQWARKGDRPG